VIESEFKLVPKNDYGGDNAGDALLYDLKYYCAQLHI
jgi:hypothetical protein